jgi:ADP-ribose pyrophosphatase
MQRRLLTTPLFSVEHKVFTLPGGERVERDVVVHPGAVVILPILDQDHIIMIRNYRYTVERELWELPAGMLEAGERPVETARRELVEETGYEAARVAPLLTFFTSPGILTEWMHAFVATGLTLVGQRLQGSERIVAEKMRVCEARRRLIDGEFCDGKTIAVLGRYFLEHGLRAKG